MRLYLVYRCPFGHRASITLREKRLPFEPVLFEAGKRPAEMAALGPHAKSPTLLDGETKVWNGQVVLEYLEDRYREPALLPGDAAGRAQVRMLIAKVAIELESRLGAVTVETLFKPTKDEAKVAQAMREFLEALADWDARLAGRDFLVGDSLSLADITLYTVFPAIHQLNGTTIPAERANLRAWLERMSARPSTPLVAPAHA
jgi:glutathione S-transferase